MTYNERLRPNTILGSLGKVAPAAQKPGLYFWSDVSESLQKSADLGARTLKGVFTHTIDGSAYTPTERARECLDTLLTHSNHSVTHYMDWHCPNCPNLSRAVLFFLSQKK